MMNIRRDTLEVTDTIQWCKEYGVEYSITVKIRLGNSWLPLGIAYHEDTMMAHLQQSSRGGWVPLVPLQGGQHSLEHSCNPIKSALIPPSWIV